MGNERASLDLDTYTSIDLEELTGSIEKKSTLSPDAIKEVAEQSGFISRQVQKTRRRRKRSPFTEQLGVKVRPDMKELFQDLGEKLEVYDHTTFELAILALIEKEGAKELLKQYKEIIE